MMEPLASSIVPGPPTRPFSGVESNVTAWAEARRRLAEADTYWLATVRPDGSPHVMPVLAVWVDHVLHFSAGAGTRKATNLARDPRCAITTGTDGLDLVVEGTAAIVRDRARLRGVADAFGSKYGWHPTAREGSLDIAGGAPTAGPPPYDVYAVTPTKVLGLPTSDEFVPTRWQFQL
jgi:nitroimidazol reductase NimA-like FMN-containing flavoprotein (pyridoxamine 5'-phosphate oxidase superfamily)